MNCPKCQGGAYLADEDVQKILESAAPMKLLIKQTFTCRACTDRFSRIVVDDVDARNKNLETMTTGIQTTSYTDPGPVGSPPVNPDQAAAGIRFLDSV